MSANLLSLKLKVLGFGVAAIVGGVAFLGGMNTAAASFTCSNGQASPDSGECWNELDTEGNATGDFRLDGGWEARFTTFDGPPSGSDGDWTDFEFTTTNLIASQFATQAGTNPQDPANIESVLEGTDWFGQELTLLSAGTLGGTSTGGILPGGTTVLYIHVGGFSMAWLYDAASEFLWSGTDFGKGLSNYRIYSVSPVPLPAALPLFGAALLGMGYLSRRRKKKALQEA